MDRGSDAGSQVGVGKNRLNSAAESTLQDGDCRTWSLRFGCGDDECACREVLQQTRLSKGYTQHDGGALGTEVAVYV